MKIALLFALASVGTARAEPISDRNIGAEIGTATGGGWTPGGFRVAVYYLSQLAARDWLDVAAAFTLGGGEAACFYDHANRYGCEHGFADGDAAEVQASVRHFFGDASSLSPFLRGGVGAGLVRFPNDVVLTMTDSTGTAMPSVGVIGLVLSLHTGGGVRMSIAPTVAVVVCADVEVGIAAFQGTSGLEPQLGFVLTAGAELRL